MRNLKTLVVATAVAGMFAAVPLANAQNATPSPKVAPSSSSINKGSRATMPSGTEAPSAAAGKPQRVVGRKKFCTVKSANGTLDCYYTSMKTCSKHNKGNNLRCVTNPNMGA